MPANPVIKKDDVKFEDRTHWLNKSVSYKQARLANQAGMSKSAVNLNVLGPDMESTEMHAHSSAEEWLYIIRGSGTLFLIPPGPSPLSTKDDPDAASKIQECTLEPGDFVGLPVPQQWAHTLKAGKGGIEYLVGANCYDADVCQYPL
ncbi:hypothetical protein A1Q2_07293 [Trichosporon asahii var. asahii CBS 8904]|uniref:Cupin type-1 domain-containing protein n=1 Tax=Trichosporon asahii var. asahii (strain CBS 8904) TaxID=1220162 RepID=K1V2Z3_TRIAC|nr:hypothetical protein A1Q2_07293 [Trichosporon asahii var. asahii CBS 8904]